MECRQGMRCLLHRPQHQQCHSRHAGRQPARVPCVQLDAHLGCKIFGQPERPAVCGGFLRPWRTCAAPIARRPSLADRRAGAADGLSP